MFTYMVKSGRFRSRDQICVFESLYFKQWKNDVPEFSYEFFQVEENSGFDDQ